MPEKTKSEIAERATRRILDATWRYTHQDESGEIWQDAVKSSAAVKLIVERAIAESRGQPETLESLIAKITPENIHAGDGEPSSAPPPKITLENCEPENREFNDKWQLVSANRVCWTGKPYARPGESLITANVGAWYATACWWREQAEKLGYVESGAAQEVSPVGSVQKITGPERPRCPVCGAETTCLSCKAGVEEVSPPSPVVEKAKAYVTICDDWRGDNSYGATSLRRKAFLELSEAVSNLSAKYPTPPSNAFQTLRDWAVNQLAMVHWQGQEHAVKDIVMRLIGKAEVLGDTRELKAALAKFIQRGKIRIRELETMKVSHFGHGEAGELAVWRLVRDELEKLSVC